MPVLMTDDGVRLSCEEAGQGTPLVFVHGFLCSHEDWKSQLKELKNSHEVVGCDLRGHGGSAVSYWSGVMWTQPSFMTTTRLPSVMASTWSWVT